MAGAMIINEAQLAALKQHAEENPLSADEIRRILAGEAPFVGDRDGHALNIPVDYRLTYAIEEIPRSDGEGTVWMRRMSMACARPGRLPHPAAVMTIAEQLGFPELEHCMINMSDGVIMLLAEYKKE